MPKDYQISQYDEPINVDGWLELPDGSRVGIERAHMEEDTGKTTHVGGGGRIHEAGLLTRRLQPRRRAARRDRLAAGHPLCWPGPRLRDRAALDPRRDRERRTAGWRRGRCESTRTSRFGQRARREYGTRCEVKNLNSLRSLQRAIDYEVGRQIALLEAGERVAQETRHWNEADGSTHALRSKEEANDYRYFPEPDLVPLVPDAELLAAAAEGVGPMPAERRRRLVGACPGRRRAVPRAATPRPTRS